MITHHRSTGGLESAPAIAEGCWIDVVDPTPEERATLVGELGVRSDFVADALDPRQVSLIEKEDGVLRLLVRVPSFAGAGHNPPYLTMPVGLVIDRDRVITISPRRHDLLRDLPDEREQQLDTRRPASFLLVALWWVANAYLRRLAEIDDILEGLEDRLTRSQQNREVIELLRYQKSLVHFTNSLRGNGLVLDRLRGDDLLELGEDERRLLDDVVIEHRQAMGHVEIAGDILSNMMDAFASIISNNLNVVMKLLTSLTIVLFVSTILATFYGMNVPLPFERSPWAFTVVAAISIAVSLLVALIFWKKRWL